MNRILIVEDDARERDGLRLLFEKSGFRVKIAADGLEPDQPVLSKQSKLSAIN